MRYLLVFLAFLLIAPASAAACPDIDGLVDLNCDGQLVIVGFGDSITFGRGDSPIEIGYPGRLVRFFPNAKVINLGKPGESTPRGRARAAASLPQYPQADYTIVLEGVNDFHLPDRSARDTRDNVLAIVKTARNVGAQTLLANLTDIRRDTQRPWVLAVNREVDPHRQIDFFSLGSGIISGDRLHPSAFGYDLMTERVVQALRIRSEASRPVDTDGDGIYDFAELRFGADPFNPDTDGDGLLDGDEVFIYGSRPNSINSDGDRFTDAEEVEMGSNPGDPRPGAPRLRSLQAIEN